MPQEPSKTASSSSPLESTGNGGELHQVAGGTHPPLTTQTGAIIAMMRTRCEPASAARRCWKIAISRKDPALRP